MKTYSYLFSAFVKIAAALVALVVVVATSVFLSAWGTRSRLEAPLFFAEMKYGRASQQYLDALLVAAREYTKAKEYANAEAQYLQACKVAHAILKGDDLSVAKIRLELSDFYWDIDERNKARSMFFGQVDLQLHKEMQRLLAAKEFDKALRLGVMSLTRRVRYEPNNKSPIVQMQVWMGIVALAAKQYEQSESFLKTGIQSMMLQQDFQAYLPLALTAYRHLGDLYSVTKKPGKAEEAYKKVVRLTDRFPESTGVEYLLCASHLGVFAQRRRQFEKASNYFARIEEFERKNKQKGPADRFITANVVKRHAEILRKTNRNEEASALEAEFKSMTQGL